MAKKKNRYRPHPKYKCIRIERSTGKVLAQFNHKGKRYTKMFPADGIDLAIAWMESVRGKKKAFFENVLENLVHDVDFAGVTFKEVYERYMQEHISTLSTATKQSRLRMDKFLKPLHPVLMEKLKPQIVARHILLEKEKALEIGNPRRFSFDHELKILKAICNWWAEEDYTFRNPVLKKHFKLGQIRERKIRNKKMTLEEIKLFFKAISDRPFWNDFAIVHFFMAARVSEVAGLLKRNLDFANRVIYVRDVVVWCKKSKEFLELKSMPKSGEERLVYMNDMVYEVLKRRAEQSPSEFIFHDNGAPLNYRRIQHTYDQCLKNAGLSDRYGGTHFMRHTMATITRLATGSLDAVQAVTGHKDQRMVQHYAALDSTKNRNAQLEVQKLLNF